MLRGLATLLDAIGVEFVISQERYNLVGHRVRLNIRATSSVPHALGTQLGVVWLVNSEHEHVTEITHTATQSVANLTLPLVAEGCLASR